MPEFSCPDCISCFQTFPWLLCNNGNFDLENPVCLRLAFAMLVLSYDKFETKVADLDHFLSSNKQTFFWSPLSCIRSDDHKATLDPYITMPLQHQADGEQYLLLIYLTIIHRTSERHGIEAMPFEPDAIP